MAAAVVGAAVTVVEAAVAVAAAVKVAAAVAAVRVPVVAAAVAACLVVNGLATRSSSVRSERHPSSASSSSTGASTSCHNYKQ